ncbi:inosine-5'-monophosphate dehydrogenase [Nitzschia inconspicua]|uniref:Inosine-5'-monophosphate dehydrogenase n=1 Tax=Nitzschia inconspicua TaxID=303405 RepID=A0A9K3KX52_9STRA|nr:inosine-5'-monophosphate dehydrogenase [Nitzschia inconspicua]
MRVSSFMIPAVKVVWVTPNDTIQKAVDLMVQHQIGAVAVLPETLANEHVDTLSLSPRLPMPIGIITKSDILKACHSKIGMEELCQFIMVKELQTCNPNVDRDKAARILEQNHSHHILVVDKGPLDENAHFVGLISSWDLSAECARDDRAWPWIRSEDGRFHKPFAPPSKAKAFSSLKHDPTSNCHCNHEKYTMYIDELDVLHFQ